MDDLSFAANQSHEVWESEGGALKLASLENPVFDGPRPPKKESYSPSILLRKAVCPGYIRDEDGDETFAELGKMAHKAVETEDMTNVPDDWKSAVQKCIDFKHDFIQNHPKGAFASETDIYYLDQHGIIDFLIILPDGSAIVVDWKFVKNWYAADSPQFHAYCVGVWNKFPDVNKIGVNVVHPFFQDQEIDAEIFERDKCYDRFMGEIVAIIEEGRRNNPEHYRVTANCANCGFAGNCPKLAQVALEVAKRYAPELELPDGPLHGSDGNITPGALAKLLAIRPAIAQALSGWYRAAMGLLLRGEEVEGYELAHRQGRRAAVPAKLAYELIKEEFIPNIELGEFLTHCVASPTGLDELISDASPTGQKAKMVAKLKGRMEDEDILSTGQGSDYIQKSRK
jgi:hypothetical protein